MKTMLLIITAIALVLPVNSAIASECVKYGKPSYSANRTVKIGPKVIRSKVFVSGNKLREEIKRGNGTEVRIITGSSMILFDPVGKTGVKFKSRKPPKRPGELRLAEKKIGKNIEISYLFKAKNGDWVPDVRTLCTSSGIPLKRQFVVVIGKKVIRATMSQSNIRPGAQSASLFKAPSDVKLTSR
ncbi:MAG: hypothetical protein L3J32_12545 [Rhizobiaceae bacterium]|nr:hypothetical protein [Rhizobiaceae bacterium]